MGACAALHHAELALLGNTGKQGAGAGAGMESDGLLAWNRRDAALKDRINELIRSSVLVADDVVREEPCARWVGEQAEEASEEGEAWFMGSIGAALGAAGGASSSSIGAGAPPRSSLQGGWMGGDAMEQLRSLSLGDAGRERASDEDEEGNLRGFVVDSEEEEREDEGSQESEEEDEWDSDDGEDEDRHRGKRKGRTSRNGSKRRGTAGRGGVTSGGKGKGRLRRRTGTGRAGGRALVESPMSVGAGAGAIASPAPAGGMAGAGKAKQKDKKAKKKKMRGKDKSKG